MTHPLPPILRTFQAGLIALALPVVAQVPNTLLHSIPAPPTGVQSGAQLGYSVAADGGYIVVGALSDDLGESNSGAVKVFDSMTGALLLVLPNPNPASDDNFGWSVAISGTRVVVGVYGDDDGANNAGSAYVYDLDGPTPTSPVFSLSNPSPATNDHFGMSVSISGTRVAVGCVGNAYVYDMAGGNPAVPVGTLAYPGPSAFNSFGNSVAISGVRVVVGSYFDDAVPDAAGSAYVYDLTSGTPSVPVFALNNPSPAAGDNFGWSVSISGSRVAVGAKGDYTAEFYGGSTYVYDLAGGTPTVPIATFSNPGEATSVEFGCSVALSGTRVVVGAYLDNTGASNAGRAYVYDLTSGTPTVPVATLNNPSPASGDYFGNSVVISGTRIVVGARLDNTGASDAGSAYLYDLTSGTPTVPVITLNNPGPASGDLFGNSVAVSGTRVVVGAWLDNTIFSDSGRAYVYNLSGATPTVPATILNNPSPSPDDRFGNSVAISGTRVVVGVEWDDQGAINAGRVYVFDLSNGTPTAPLFTLNNPTPAASDAFGGSLAISGTWIVVGAAVDDTGATDTGSVYVYDLASGTPTVPVFTLNNPQPGASDFFGAAVAISGTRVVVGASGDSSGGISAGGVHVYDLASGTPTVPLFMFTNPAPATADRFGDTVAISGTRVAVGAPTDNAGGVDTGSAYVYDLSSASPTLPVTTLSNPSPSDGERFGTSVGISEARVVIGATNDFTGVTNTGRAYVYDLGSGAPSVPVAILNGTDPKAGDLFGESVAIDGATVAIGSPGDDSPQSNKGSAYIFGPHPDGDADGLRDAWELSYWPTTTGHSPLDDSDHDGYNELLELALGLNPTLPSAGALPPAINEGGYLTMTITKQAGVTYEVQSAGTLLPAQPDSFSSASTTVLTNNTTTLEVRDNFLISTAPGRFMRVKVTASP